MVTRRRLYPMRTASFCVCAVHNGVRSARKRVTCSTKDYDTGKSAAISRRAALHAFGMLAASVAIPSEADVEYPALEIGRKALLPRWLDEAKSEEPHDDKETGAHATWKVGNGLSLAAEMRILALRLGVAGFVSMFSVFGMAMSDRHTRRVPLPEKYDPGLVARYFSLRVDKVAGRLVQLAVEAARLAALRARDAMEELRERSLDESVRAARASARRVRRASALRATMSRLGPAFIKLAQAISMRPDVFGGEAARQLRAMQDEVVAPFDVADAIGLIGEQLGARPQAIFDSFDVKPVAGSSLGMVFRATIDGRTVAVKVQRPGVRESIALDFFIIRKIVGIGKRLFRYRAELLQAVDDYASRMYEELDYRNEVANMLKFREIYKGTDKVYVPRPYTMYSSRKVLIMEYVEGEKIIDKNYEIQELEVVETGIQFALTQLLDKGFLHAGRCVFSTDVHQID